MLADEASKNEKDEKDLEKLENPIINFYSKTSDGQKVSIDSRPINNASKIPLYAETTTASSNNSYSINYSKVNMPLGVTLYLHDKKLNVYSLIEEGNSYTFTITSADSTKENRFELTKQPVLLTNNTTGIAMNVYAAKDVIQVKYSLSNATNTSIRLLNMQGVQLAKTEMGGALQGECSIGSKTLSSGMYIVELQSGNSKISKQVLR